MGVFVNVYMYQLAGRHQSLALQQRILMLRLLGCSSAQRVGLLCKALRVQGAGAERRSKGFEEVTRKQPKSPKFEAPPALEPPRLGLRALPEGVSCSLAAKEGLVEW